VSDRTRPVVAPARGEGGGDFEVEARRVLALAADVVQRTGEEGRAAAEALGARVAALPGRWPGEQVQSLLRRLLDEPGLCAREVSPGQTLRRTFLSVQQTLGFPWALELSPEDLAILSPPPAEARSPVLRTLTFLSALVSAMWSGWVVFMSLAILSGNNFEWVVAAGFAFASLGVAHSVAAMSTVVSIRSTTAAVERLKRLGACFLLGPLAGLAVSAAGRDISMMAIGLIFAAPSMVTAALCGATAWGLSSSAGEPAPRKPSP
jgi:hypothetical protein